jgi:hypothetical protein
VKKLPVIAIIREAYDFTFANLGAIIGLIWLPMVLVTVGEFFVSQNYGSQVQAALEAGDANAVGPAALVMFLFALAALALYAMIFTAVTQLAMGQRAPGAMLHFTFGALEWRVFRTLFGIVLFLLPGYLLLLLSSGRLDAASIGTPQGAASLLTTAVLVCAMIYFAVRLTGVLLPVVITDGKAIIVRAWTLGAGNFWRLLGVMAGVILPLYIVMIFVMAGIVGSGLTPGAMPTPEEVRAISAANRPLIAGLGFLVAPLLIGLTVSASVFCWRALNQNGARTDISA